MYGFRHVACGITQLTNRLDPDFESLGLVFVTEIAISNYLKAAAGWCQPLGTEPSQAQSQALPPPFLVLVV